jgi:hypothetical protein
MLVSATLFPPTTVEIPVFPAFDQYEVVPPLQLLVQSPPEDTTIPNSFDTPSAGLQVSAVFHSWNILESLAGFSFVHLERRPPRPTASHPPPVPRRHPRNYPVASPTHQRTLRNACVLATHCRLLYPRQYTQSLLFVFFTAFNIRCFSSWLAYCSLEISTIPGFSQPPLS